MENFSNSRQIENTDHTKDKTHLVVVRYDLELSDNVLSGLSDSFDSVEIVWTNPISKKYIDGINERYEFSGYQAGLNRVLTTVNGEPQQHQNLIHTIVFVNDTAFKSHSRLLTRFLLKSFLRNKRYFPKNTSAVGLLSNFPTTEAEFLRGPGYLSTWIFAIQGNLKSLKEIEFFEKELDREKFSTDVYDTLPFSYRTEVNRWLQPKNWIKGWHGSIPGVQPADSILIRKRFTIYLEHNWPVLLAKKGCGLTDVSTILQRHECMILSVLRVIDRAKINIIKIFTRINHITKKNK